MQIGMCGAWNARFSMGFAHCTTGIANSHRAGGVLGKGNANPRTTAPFYVENKKMKKKKNEKEKIKNK